VVTERRHFESREVLEGFVRRQLWIDPKGANETRFQSALDSLAIRDEGGWMIHALPPIDIGVVTWSPR
jgi:hypothetical protein